MEKETEQGHIHPMTQFINKANGIFYEMGFTLVDGPELETEHYNFDTLNVPKDHPARDMQDTFWLKQKEGEERKLMRTQTSPVQIRYMEKNKPPYKMICFGKVFRNEATDATHEMVFHQLEGLMIDKNVTMADLKSTINIFFDKFFERDVEVRFRPSFFPFVEPGLEVDISCFKCDGGVLPSGDTCPVCKGTTWVEVMGAGMVHPKVLAEVNLDSKEWQGFAFGMGVDRIVMLKYGIDDIRLLYSGDLRLVNQF
jgi:phenylalanyl-tRNA synthetase alpha chain